MFYSDVGYSNVLLTHTVTRKTKSFFFLFIFTKPYKNYIHRNSACPQRKPWLAPTYSSYCLRGFLPNDRSGATEKKGILKKAYRCDCWKIKTHITHC